VSKLALVLIAAVVSLGGCGESDETSEGQSQQVRLEQAKLQRAAAHRAKMRQHARAAARRHHRQVMARRHRARVRAEEAERRAAEAAEAEAVAAEEEGATEEEASECDPNYSGACLDPYASDYDCEGGSGNGPEYTGTVTVVGEDHYGLDADSDGTGCEPY
jgi:FKBP-type peptidyl-prolyl cis-trans isomerase